MEVRGQGVGSFTVWVRRWTQAWRWVPLSAESSQATDFFIWFLFWDCVGLECPVILYFSLPAAGSQSAPPGLLRKHIFSITVPSTLEPGIFFKGPFTMFAHKGVFLRFGISSRWIFHILVKNVSGPVSFSSVLNFPLAALSCDSCSRVWSPQGCLSRLQRMLLEAAGIHFLVTI